MVTPYRCTICARLHELADGCGMRTGVPVCEVHSGDLVEPGACRDWVPWVAPDECRAILSLAYRMARDGRV